jgi:hypothetical protein
MPRTRVTTVLQQVLARTGTLLVLATSAATPAQAEGAPPEQAPDASGEQPDLAVPRPNQGHFLSVALLSAAAVGLDSARPNRSWTPGFGVNVQLGEAVTDWLDLGIGFAYGRTFGDDDDRLTFGRLSLHSQWYLDPRWFARLDIGAGSVSGPDPRNPSRSRGGYGDMYALGVGANVFLSPGTQSGGWVLSPVVGVELAPSDDLSAVIGWVGLELSLWSGLSKDKLRLPTDRAYE